MAHRDSFDSSIPPPSRRHSSSSSIVIPEIRRYAPSSDNGDIISGGGHDDFDGPGAAEGRASTERDYPGGEADETLSIPSVEPRSTPYKAEASRNLNVLDVASLIINKMVGSGIFTGPYTVLLATQNKSIAVVLWVLGFVYTIFSMWVYLEFARDLPYTGGELVYLDYVFSRFRLLAYTLYVFYFIFLYSTSVNAMRFGQYVLLAASPDKNPELLDQRLVRFLAVSITVLIALLLYFSSSKSRLINVITAVVKIGLLLAVLIAVAVYAHKNGSTTDDWLRTGQGSKTDWTSAVMTVFFGYHGWDNAVLVAGEIPSYKVLRNGFYLGTLVVGILYISITTALCFAFSWTSGAGLGPLEDYFSMALGGTRNAKVAAAVLIALSATSSNLSVTYTSVRVKQSIGWANILPFSNIWARSAPLRQKVLPAEYLLSPSDEAYIVRRGTPEGGIILNVLICIFWICLPSAFAEGFLSEISFPGLLLVYGHFIVEGFVGIAFCFWFDRTINSPRERPEQGWVAAAAPSWLQPGKLAWYFVGGVTVLFSLAIIVCAPIEPKDRAYVYTTVAVIFAGLAYWYLFVRCPSAASVGRVLGFRLTEQTHGIDDEADPWRQCSLCVSYPRGAKHRHREDGYLTWNAFEFDVDSKIGRFLKHWFGSQDVQHENVNHGFVTEHFKSEGVPGEVMRERGNIEYE